MAYVSEDFARVGVIPCISLVVEIVMLISCKKRVDKPYGHNYCLGMHSAIISMLLFVDAMMSLYYIVDLRHYVYWVIGIAVIYCICVFARYFWISMKIARGWYRECELKMNQSGSAAGTVCGVGTILVAKSLATHMTGDETTKMLFIALIGMCFVVIKYVDYFMLYYCFTKLSKEEQDYICGKQGKKGRIPQKSVYEVIGKK